MSVAPHAGIIDFGTFTPPTETRDGIQGEVPKPLIGQQNYVLTASGWAPGGGGSMIYPSAGIPNSTGTAWGASYGVTGTGNVVLNSNPVFATDVTVNGTTVGRGNGAVSTNLAVGASALASPYITASNTQNVAIGSNTLNNNGIGVFNLSIDNAGSGYTFFDGTDTLTSFAVTSVPLVYESGPPSTGAYPVANITVVDGELVDIVVASPGYGFTNSLLTKMKLGTFAGLSDVTDAVIGINSLAISGNNTAIGYNAGSNNYVGRNTIYIGANANGIGSNQIVIGANVTGGGTNTVTIGDENITNTTLRGTVTASSFNGQIVANGATINSTLTGTAQINLAGSQALVQNFASSQTTGALNIGGSATNTTGTITLGRSPAAQIVDIASGVNTSATKTVNIGLGGTAGLTNINLGPTAGTGTITVGQSTAAQTVNIATGVSTATKTVNIGTSSSSGATNITIGSTAGSGALTVGPNNSSGTTTIGGASGVGTITIGRSTGAQTVAIASGVNTATKTVTIGTGASTGATNITIGATAGTSITLVNGTLRQQTYTVTTLPAGVAGARSFVTDALSPTFGATVVTGGTIGVPVYHDGTSWKVG